MFEKAGVRLDAPSRELSRLADPWLVGKGKDPVHLGEGLTESVGISGRHHHDDQDKPDHVDGDRPLEGEYCPVKPAGEKESTAPERAAPAAHAQDAPFERSEPAPVGPPSIHAHDLVKFYFELIGSPVQFKGHGPQWEKLANAMLVDDSLEDLKGIAEYAINHKAFWQAKMLVLSRDPFRYFQQCVNSTDDYSLRAQYGGIKNARAFNQRNKSEAKHAQKTTNGKPNTETRADKARAAAEQAKRDILGLGRR